MASFLEFNFDVSGINEGLMLAYGITTALVVRSSVDIDHVLSFQPGCIGSVMRHVYAKYSPWRL